MKTALAAPDDGPDKKKYGIPPKDKKGLSKKTEYKYESKQVSKNDGREKKYLGYGSNPKDRYSSEDHNMSARKPDPKDKPKDDERKNPKPKSPQIGREEYKKSQMQSAMKPRPKDDKPKPKPKDPGFEPKIKKNYKVVENKIKKPEDKEKANKLKKTASRSKTSIRMKKRDK